MAGFLDACIQASNIIVPFLDTVISDYLMKKILSLVLRVRLLMVVSSLFYLMKFWNEILLSFHASYVT